MKRIISVTLALLAAILFPILIWVALFIAIRRPLVNALKRIGTVALALLAGVFSPILIWAGLGAALNLIIRDWRLRRVSVRSVGKILAAARLTVQWETEKESVESAIFVKQPMPEIRQLLARVGFET